MNDTAYLLWTNSTLTDWGGGSNSGHLIVIYLYFIIIVIIVKLVVINELCMVFQEFQVNNSNLGKIFLSLSCGAPLVVVNSWCPWALVQVPL